MCQSSVIKFELRNKKIELKKFMYEFYVILEDDIIVSSSSSFVEAIEDFSNRSKNILKEERRSAHAKTE